MASPSSGGAVVGGVRTSVAAGTVVTVLANSSSRAFWARASCSPVPHSW